MKLQSWGTSYPSHKCETKMWVDWMFKPCNLTTWRKQLLHYAFHSSLQEYCGEDVACSTNLRKYYHCSIQSRWWSFCNRKWFPVHTRDLKMTKWWYHSKAVFTTQNFSLFSDNRSVCEMESKCYTNYYATPQMTSDITWELMQLIN